MTRKEKEFAELIEVMDKREKKESLNGKISDLRDEIMGIEREITLTNIVRVNAGYEFKDYRNGNPAYPRDYLVISVKPLVGSKDTIARQLDLAIERLREVRDCLTE